MREKVAIRDIFERLPDFDGVLIFADGMHSMRSPTHFEYFSGASAVADRNCLCATRSGDRFILVNLPRDVGRIRRQSQIDDVRGTRSFIDSISSIASEELTGKVGVAGIDRIPPDIWSALDSSLSSWESIDDELVTMTTKKSPEEIRLFKELGRVADIGFSATYETIRPGITEYELAAEVEYAMREAGAEDNFNLFGTERHNQLMHSPTDRIIRSGDTILCELSPMIDGYVTQICRTISLGPPSATLVDTFSIVQEAMKRTVSKLSPGSPASVIYSSMNEVFEREGYGEYCKPPYMRTRGHEFGFGEIGMAINEDTHTKLNPGMVLVIHPNQYLPETGYLALGDPILVTEDGIETLTHTPQRLFTKEVAP